jgi:uncharacterized protein
MVALPETEEDAFLDEGQQAEERVGATEWTVWRCPIDESMQKLDEAGNSAWSRCASCGYRTVSRHRQTVLPPTETHTGVDRVVTRCVHCGVSDEHEVVTPKYVPPPPPPPVVYGGGGFGGGGDFGGGGSFGGGGDFGGGSSGGGGAGSSW